MTYGKTIIYIVITIMLMAGCGKQDNPLAITEVESEGRQGAGQTQRRQEDKQWPKKLVNWRAPLRRSQVGSTMVIRGTASSIYVANTPRSLQDLQAALCSQYPGYLVTLLRNKGEIFSVRSGTPVRVSRETAGGYYSPGQASARLVVIKSGCHEGRVCWVFKCFLAAE